MHDGGAGAHRAAGLLGARRRLAHPERHVPPARARGRGGPRRERRRACRQEDVLDQGRAAEEEGRRGAGYV